MLYFDSIKYDGCNLLGLFVLFVVNLLNIVFINMDIVVNVECILYCVII